MKLSSKLLASLSLALWVMSAPTLLIASPKSNSILQKTKSGNRSLPVKYSLPPRSITPILKWPRGSLIFPEVNKPNKTGEVFIFGEMLTSPEALSSLHQHYGVQYLSRKKYRKAKAEYLKALKLTPHTRGIHKRLALIYLKTKNYRYAEIAFRKALKLDPGYISGITKLGISLAGQKKYTLAERSFKKAIQADPSNANYHLNLGHYYFYLRNNFKGARRSYQKALKLNPRLKDARSNMRRIKRKFRGSKSKERDFKNSWGTDFEYGDSGDPDAQKTPGRPSKEGNTARTWDEQNSQRPLF